MTTTPSIVGFKEPRADLHRQSPKIFTASICLTVLVTAMGIHVPMREKPALESTVKAPPVIIQLENIPETRQTITTAAPKLGMPIEVNDELLLDDVTIESTGLDISATVDPTPPPIQIMEDAEPEVVEEEIFEFFAVQEVPKRIAEVAPEYPEAARQAGIEGTVFVRALVGKDGTVTEATVLKGPDLLHAAAIDAALKTKFTPAKQNGMPVSCWVQIPFRFELQ